MILGWGGGMLWAGGLWPVGWLCEGGGVSSTYLISLRVD